MNFFDAQDNARRITRWLVIVYVAATLLIIAAVTTVVAIAMLGMGVNGNAIDPSALGSISVLTLLLIVGATLYRTARLASGGGRVAEELGGVLVTPDNPDPKHRRLMNVVEEMAIASGMPVPAVYVLEQEHSINAFAAGFSVDDAAVAVTRGTLDTLSRSELQGVVAHEFSHILNGDMRLNIRMMGVLFGIMAIGLVGRMIVRGQTRVRISGSRKNGGGIVLLGIGLTAIGWIGVFFARLIKAAVSRQREYLADASAVQFTRQTDGIANALKKIGGYSQHSYLEVADAEQVSHMLFAVGARLSSLFATHPPLTERIRALDPSFDDSQYPSVEAGTMAYDETANPVDSRHDDVRAAGFVSAATPAQAAAVESVIDSIGHPGPEHVAYAAALRRSIPEELLAAAHSFDEAWLLVLALLIDPGETVSARQLDLLTQQIGAQRVSRVKRFYASASTLGAEYALPLTELAFPALRQSSEKTREYLMDTGRRLIELDGEIDLREFCLFYVLAKSLQQAENPSARRGESPSRREVRQAATDLLRILARHGHSAKSDQASAFAAGLRHFGKWGRDLRLGESGDNDVSAFGAALRTLERMGSSAKETLVRAATATVLEDQQVTVREAEMLRTVCAALECPMPPILGAGASGT